MIRLLRWIVAAWATIWLFRAARANRELARAVLESIDDVARISTVGYPNEWGVRTTPLTPGETARALAYERHLAVTAQDPREPEFPNEREWVVPWTRANTAVDRWLARLWGLTGPE